MEDKPEEKPIEEPKANLKGGPTEPKATLNRGLTEPKATLNEDLKKPNVEPKEWPKLDRDVRCPSCGEMVNPLVVTTEKRGTRYLCPECGKVLPTARLGDLEEKEGKGPKESIVKKERKPKEILADVLSRHPDLTSKHTAYILSAVKDVEVPHPYEIWWYLNNLRGVDRKTAEMIMYQYQSAIQPLSRESSVPPPMIGHQQQVPPPPWMAPWQMPQYNPYNPMTPQMPVQQQPVQSFPIPYNPQPQPQANVSHQSSEKSFSEDDVIRIIEKREREKKERLTKEDLVELIKGRGEKPRSELSEERFLELVDQRNAKRKEEEEKSALMETLNLIRQGMDNLNTRITSVERAGSLAKPVEKVKNPLQDQIDSAVGKRITSMILGEGAVTLDQVRAATSDEIRKHTPPPPTGKRNQYDMEVEKATHDAEARKIEAEERRRGYEAIAGGIRDGLASVGWNIGAGAAGGPVRFAPSAETQPEIRMSASEPQLPIKGADGQRYVNCPRCHNPLMIPEGQARVMCSMCGEIINIMTREEELKQKVSAEKSKTPETKAEVKNVKPEREEEKPPEVEKPESIEEKPSGGAKPEEKPPETEEPKSTGEKPSAGAKSEEKSKGELDVKATEKAEGVAT